MIFAETVLSGAKHPGTELEVLESVAGFYLGFRDEDGLPYSRETVYFGDRASAELVLKYMRGASVDARNALVRAEERAVDRRKQAEADADYEQQHEHLFEGEDNE